MYDARVSFSRRETGNASPLSTKAFAGTRSISEKNTRPFRVSSILPIREANSESVRIRALHGTESPSSIANTDFGTTLDAPYTWFETAFEKVAEFMSSRASQRIDMPPTVSGNVFSDTFSKNSTNDSSRSSNPFDGERYFEHLENVENHLEHSTGDSNLDDSTERTPVSMEPRNFSDATTPPLHAAAMHPETSNPARTSAAVSHPPPGPVGGCFTTCIFGSFPYLSKSVACSETYASLKPRFSRCDETSSKSVPSKRKTSVSPGSEGILSSSRDARFDRSANAPPATQHGNSPRSPHDEKFIVESIFRTGTPHISKDILSEHSEKTCRDVNTDHRPCSLFLILCFSFLVSRYCFEVFRARIPF